MHQFGTILSKHSILLCDPLFAKQSGVEGQTSQSFDTLIVAPQTMKTQKNFTRFFLLICIKQNIYESVQNLLSKINLIKEITLLVHKSFHIQ